MEVPKALSTKEIEDYFRIKRAVRTITTLPEVLSFAGSNGIRVDESDLSELDSLVYRKYLVGAYVDQNISMGATEEEHFRTMGSTVETLKGYLNNQNATCALWVGGSFANGKPNGLHSDIDLYFCLRRALKPSDIAHTTGIFQNLGLTGIVITDEEKTIEKTIEEVMIQGEGVARVDAMTIEGIDVDIHCLGELDLRRMHFLSPGRIRRLYPVEPYNQLRVSFTGEKKQVRVNEQFIENYFPDTVPIKGIYLDNLSAGAVLVYDYENYGQNISDQIWIAIVKGYIYHNNGYIRNQTGRVVGINRDVLSFHSFLRTLYYQELTSYSLQRLRYLEQHYFTSLLKIEERYHLI